MHTIDANSIISGERAVVMHQTTQNASYIADFQVPGPEFRPAYTDSTPGNLIWSLQINMLVQYAADDLAVAGAGEQLQMSNWH